MQAGLVALQRQDVIGALVDDLGGDLALATDGVDGHHGPLDHQEIQELRNGDDLVRLVLDPGLSQNHVLLGAPGRDHVDRRLRAGLLVGAPERLAVDRDDILGEAHQGGRPGDEAALELLRVQHREDVAELVVRGRSGREGAETTQKIQLVIAVSGDLDPALAAGQHTQEREQQHLVQRIEHLGALARVLQIFETLQKFNDLIERRQGLLRSARHRPHLRRESLGKLGIQSCEEMSRPNSPDCPGV